MSETPHETKKIVGGKANWLGDELQQSSDWIHIFDAKEIDEIEEAVTRATSLGCSLETLTKEEFPLPISTCATCSRSSLKLLKRYPQTVTLCYNVSYGAYRDHFVNTNCLIFF